MYTLLKRFIFSFHACLVYLYYLHRKVNNYWMSRRFINFESHTIMHNDLPPLAFSQNLYVVGSVVIILNICHIKNIFILYQYATNVYVYYLREFYINIFWSYRISCINRLEGLVIKSNLMQHTGLIHYWNIYTLNQQMQ